jgi:hypothetical protein
MRQKAFSLFMTLLLVAGLAALAQSPTSSAPAGGSETKDPYGATLDHPNPGSPNPAREGQTPATGKTTMTGTTTTEPSTSTTPTTETTPSMSATTPSDMNGSSASSGSLPRTASDLPLLATIGLLSLGAALMVRSIAKREV